MTTETVSQKTIEQGNLHFNGIEYKYQVHEDYEGKVLKVFQENIFAGQILVSYLDNTVNFTDQHNQTNLLTSTFAVLSNLDVAIFIASKFDYIITYPSVAFAYEKVKKAQADLKLAAENYKKERALAQERHDKENSTDEKY